MSKNISFSSCTPKVGPKYAISTSKRDDQHPHYFHMGVPSSPNQGIGLR